MRTSKRTSKILNKIPAAFVAFGCAALLFGQKPAAKRPVKKRQHAPVVKPVETYDDVARLIKGKVKHVFVIYQENRSFDSYFGSFPGAENLASPDARRHGFRQYDPLGKTWVTPFLLNAADTSDVTHLRPDLIAKSNHGKMDQFVQYEENFLQQVATPQLAHQLGLLTMAFQDCKTVPFLWTYAHRFALYDHIFQGMYGPSTPGNIELIAAQTGQTQAARHPEQTARSYDAPGEPVFNDLAPAEGPYDYDQPGRALQFDQTYATLMLTLRGRDARDAKEDSDDIKEDINELVDLDHQAVPWGWFQEGFGNGEGNNHPAYLAYHNALQYFGYIRKNAPLWSGVHDLLDFFFVMEKRELPSQSVVFVKGGKMNPFGWVPADPRARFILGDDDHAAYSDSQLSESLVAKVVNEVARSPYWSSSAIIIFWDDAGGFYDHVPPPQFERCPDGHPCGDGPRIPLILISPYAKSGAIVSDQGDHASFAKFLNVLFELPPLASLPDEKPYLPEGPRDMNSQLTNLLGGFDRDRLTGTKPPIPASDAEIPDEIVNHFPAAMTCEDTGVTPVSVPGALHPPKIFNNPLP
jgi:phospholipase C